MLAGFGVLLSAPPLSADEPPPPHAVRLDYLRGPGAERCPEEQAFRSAVELPGGASLSERRR